MKSFTVLFAVFMLLGMQEALSHFFNNKWNWRKWRLPEHKHNLHRTRLSINGSRPLVPDNMKTKWITQKLDNFNKTNTATWQMRYAVDDTVYKPGGPMFVYIGAEWTIEPSNLYYLQLIDFVEKYNGILFYTEHRFYGESQPTPTLTVESMDKYLNIEQALADLANFITTMKKTVHGGKKSKVILLGESLAGTMAAWFAKLYPNLLDYAWASSSPLYSEYNFVKYQEEAGQAILKVGGQQCYDRLQNAFTEARQMVTNGSAAELKSMLKLCDNFNMADQNDVSNFFYEYGEDFSGSVQFYGKEGIDNICANFTSNNTDIYTFADYFVRRFKYDNETCVDLSYEATLNRSSNLSPEMNKNAVRQWQFQTCNEFGWFQSSDSPNQPFGPEFSVEFFTKMCIDLFGPKYTLEHTTKRIEYYNKKFGAYKPNLPNVYFTQGSLDPWRVEGIGYTIEGAYHTQDMDLPSSTDTPQMAAAHKKMDQIMKKWITSK